MNATNMCERRAKIDAGPSSRMFYAHGLDDAISEGRSDNKNRFENLCKLLSILLNCLLC